jgi:hypothetical protein
VSHRKIGKTTVLLLLAAARVSAQGPYDKLLSPADVEKATGATGVKLVARLSQTGAGGDLNFARGDGKLLVMVNFGNAQLYTRARTQKQITIGGQTYPMELFAHAVPGLGDEAFASPPGTDQYVLYVRKGEKAISVSTYLAPELQSRPRLTMAQLQEIAKIILSRWT